MGDSDLAMSIDRRSISGYAFKLCNEISLISWKTRKKSIVALSTCEAEHIALATATQEAKFLRQLLADLMCLPCKSVCMYVCNEISLISWTTRKKSIVALSTCEAEHIALATATQEAKFLRQLLADLMCLPCKSVCMYVDNQGAIALANNQVHHKGHNILM